MSSVSLPIAKAAPRRRWRTMLAELTLRRALVSLLLAVLIAALINSWFVTPFTVLLGRTIVIAAVLLLAFAVAGAVHPAWIPKWLAQVLAVVLIAPLISYIVYIPAVGGAVFEVFEHEARFMGWMQITFVAMIVGPLIGLGALYRERDAQARSEALRFALERSTLEKQALDAELRALHAQIKPHFLFNTLANVQELVETGSPRAAEVLRHLITYLSSAVPRLDESNATLGNELALVRAYLELMHLRMPDRLQFEVDAPEGLAAQRFPTMALLTLVENAVKHGIDPSEQGGSIRVTVRIGADGALIAEVADTGIGIRSDAPAGTGLSNLRARVAAYWRPGGRLELQENEPRGVVARIEVPAAALP
jgi:two-component sensor histidine kinase